MRIIGYKLDAGYVGGCEHCGVPVPSYTFDLGGGKTEEVLSVWHSDGWSDPEPMNWGTPRDFVSYANLRLAEKPPFEELAWALEEPLWLDNVLRVLMHDYRDTLEAKDYREEQAGAWKLSVFIDLVPEGVIIEWANDTITLTPGEAERLATCIEIAADYLQVPENQPETAVPTPTIVSGGEQVIIHVGEHQPAHYTCDAAIRIVKQLKKVVGAF